MFKQLVFHDHKLRGKHIAVFIYSRWIFMMSYAVKVDLTFIVSEGEVEVPSSLGSQRKQEVMSILWLIGINSTQSLNDLRGQRSAHKRESQLTPNGTKRILFVFSKLEF